MAFTKCHLGAVLLQLKAFNFPFNADVQNALGHCVLPNVKMGLIIVQSAMSYVKSDAL